MISVYPHLSCVAINFVLGFPNVMGSRMLLKLKEIAEKEEQAQVQARVMSSIRFEGNSALGSALVRSIVLDS